MRKRLYRLERMKSLEREFRVAQVAMEILDQALRVDASVLTSRQLSPADAVNVIENLEATYLLRLFAEFEAGLRDVWENAYTRPTTPRMTDLVEATAAYGDVPDDIKDSTHEVRRFRNSLVHEGSEEAVAVSFETARKCLCTFFSRVPLDW